MTEYAVPGISIRGEMTLIVNLKIKEIYSSALGTKCVVVVYQKGDGVIEEKLLAGDILTITFPISPVNDLKAEQTVQKIKDVIKELSK